MISHVQSPKISVLMPVYNADQFLPETLKSLIDQTFTEWECICINDGSTDQSLSILEEFASRDRRFIVHSQPNSGSAGKPRNRALELSRGEFIFELDADDRITPGLLQTVYDRALQTNSDYVIPTLSSFFPETQTTTVSLIGYKGDISVLCDGHKAFEASILWEISGLGLLKREIALQIPYIENNLYGDELTTRLRLLQCNQVAFCEESYIYTQHSQSVTKSISPKRFDIHHTHIELLKILEQEKFPDSSVIYYAEQFSMNLLQGTYLFVTQHSPFSAEECQSIRSKLLTVRLEIIKITRCHGGMSIRSILTLFAVKIALLPFFPGSILRFFNRLRKKILSKQP